MPSSAEAQPPRQDLEAELGALARAALGAGLERLEPLPAGLGLRRFFRLHLRGGPGGLASAIARVEAPEDPAGRPAGIPPEPPLEPVRSLLAAHGLPVPARYGGDAARGIDLLEDLGDRSLESAARQASPAERRALYAEACALVPRLQRVAPPPGAALPAFARRLDAALLAYKADLFAAHSLPAALGRPPAAGELAAVRAAFACVAEEVAAAPARLAHRDLQSSNLRVRPGLAPAPAARLVLIDVQGAFLAPPEYDLACLLRDSYVELPEDEWRAQLERVRPRLPDAPDPDVCARRFDLLTLARKAKDHARFLYAARARGDARYLRYLPATLRALRGAARRCAPLDPRLARLADWIEALPEDPCGR